MKRKKKKHNSGPRDVNVWQLLGLFFVGFLCHNLRIVPLSLLIILRWSIIMSTTQGSRCRSQSSCIISKNSHQWNRNRRKNLPVVKLSLLLLLNLKEWNGGCWIDERLMRDRHAESLARDVPVNLNSHACHVYGTIIVSAWTDVRHILSRDKLINFDTI